jgi:hypothetical protein
MDKIIISDLSTQSIFLELTADGKDLGSATGFIVMHGEKPYLITNWHVVTGKHPDTHELINDYYPDEIVISHHARFRLGTWTKQIEPLEDLAGNPRWIEHPRGSQVDVVALPLQIIPSIDDAIQLYPLDLSSANTDLKIEPGMAVSIIGYPFGLHSGRWPIWKTGHIATDPDLSYEGRPAFLIDATTRPGMSGSPVVVRMWGGFLDNAGNHRITCDATTRFLGIYSGTIYDTSEIGRVWRPQVIGEILNVSSRF